MDRFRKFDKFSYGILDDPTLKTTANDFKFKYIPKEQFQRVIKMVAKDRTKEKKAWADHTPKQAMTSKEYSNSSVRGKKFHKNTNKHTIKTEKSTIKILTHPTLDKSPQFSRTKILKKKKDYIIPKIRIMTDEEIQKVVENAVKEIMEQDDVRHEVTARSMRHKYDEMKPLYSHNLDLDSIFNESYRNDYSKSVLEFCDVFHETNTYNDYGHEDLRKESIQSVMDEDLQTENILGSFSKSSLNFNEVLRVSDKKSTPRWVEKFNEADENLSNLIENNSFHKESLVEDVNNKDPMPTGNVPNSYRSVSIHSLCSLSAESISLQSKENIEEDQTFNHTLETIGESSKTTLTSFEKKELETLLGVKTIVEQREVDLDSCESKSIGDEFEEENEKEIKTNIFPVVHIRQPKQGKNVESVTNDKNENSAPITPPEFDDMSFTNSDLTYPRHEAGQENVEEPFDPKKSSRAATPIAQPVKKIPLTYRQLDTSEASSYKSNTSKNSSMPKISKAQKSVKSPKTPHDLSPYKSRDINEDKLLIFSKITSYQEKIVGLLDQLRINLLNLSLPDGQPDRKRRENHVIEFTARFSRNYLYQLERMIKDLQLISKEQYLSRHSNEHRTKICVIYGILYQATQSYLKQIKYFLLDQSPRKLDVLIGFIVNATHVCIHKNVFDKKDKVVSCLLDRCNSMLSFLEDLKDHRRVPLITDRSVKNAKPKVAPKLEAPVKNKLSMYEPSLFSTTRKRKVVKKKKTKKVKEESKKETQQPKKPVPEVKTNSNREENITNLESKKSNLNINESTSNLFQNGFPDFEKEILTQMEKLTKENANTISPPNMMSSEDLSIDCFDSGTTKLEDDESEMKARVYEALQTITKQQVHQMLGPLVCNLGCILNKSTSAMDLETLLNDLNSINSQVVKPTPTGSGTFNRKDDTEEAHNCEDSKFLEGEHAAGTEHRLDLTQSKQCARALLNRRLDSLPSGEDCDVVIGTSHRRVELLVPPTSPRELSTIEEERPNHPKGEGGAGDRPTSAHPSDKKVQQLRYDRNIQFTFVSSEDDFVETKEKTPGIVNMEFNLPLEELCDQVFYEEKIYSKPEADTDEPEVPKEEHLEGILEDRMNFIRHIADNPLYVNEYYSQPWKVITRIAKKIVDQTIYDVEKDISFGEESFLDDFLKLEIDLKN